MKYGKPEIGLNLSRIAVNSLSRCYEIKINVFHNCQKDIYEIDILWETIL